MSKLSYDGDEPLLTIKLSKFLNKKIMIDMSFVASHLSFYSQTKQNDEKLLVEYKKLIEK